MSTRLVIAIVTTALQEAGIAAVGFWLLPKVDVHIPALVIIFVMLALLAYDVFTYRVGTRALDRKPAGGLADMVGMRGEVVRRLDPEGMVRIKGETWKAKSAGRTIDVGEEVTVVDQERLRLIVERVGRRRAR